MSRPLKHVDLFLEEDLIEKLEEESRRRRASMSEVVGALLAQDLGAPRKLPGAIERIRKLRAEVGSIQPDGATIIRESRDRGW
jgi:uncharacterized protein (UPF0335 family)